MTLLFERAKRASVLSDARGARKLFTCWPQQPCVALGSWCAASAARCHHLPYVIRFMAIVHGMRSALGALRGPRPADGRSRRPPSCAMYAMLIKAHL